jgi:hypothetical protein
MTPPIMLLPKKPTAPPAESREATGITWVA